MSFPSSKIKISLCRSTILAALPLIDGLLGASFFVSSAKADNCTNGGSGTNYICDGQITSTQGTWEPGGDLNVSLVGPVSTATNTLPNIFFLQQSGYNITFSGGAPEGVLSAGGGKNVAVITGYGNGSGNFTITNSQKLISSSIDINASSVIDNFTSAYGIEVSTYANPTAIVRITNAENASINVTSGNLTSNFLDQYPLNQAVSYSVGILANSEASSGSLLENKGSITATSGAVVDGSNTIVASQSIAAGIITGVIPAINTGVITATSGDATGYVARSLAAGIAGFSDGGSIQETNSGVINVFGGNSFAQADSLFGIPLKSIAAGLYAQPFFPLSGEADFSVDKTLINNGLITAAGPNAYGIYAAGNAGTVDILNSASGSIYTSGASGAGIYASTTSNTINVTNDGIINSTNGAAIAVRNIDTGLTKCLDNVASCTTTITNTGTLIGLGTSVQTATIAIDPAGEGNAARTIINNSGLITTQSGSINDYAIAVGSPLDTRVTVNNTGTIIGRIEINQTNASFINSTGWISSGSSLFLGGNNSVTNAAGATMTTVGDTTILMNGDNNTITNDGTITTISGTDGGGVVTLDPPNNHLNFYNSGLIDMSNDGVGSVRNRVNVDGNFIASGKSTVAVNSQLGGIGSRSDRLMIAGNATGSNTNVIIRDAVGGLGGYNPFGIAVVGVAGDRSSSFTLDPSSDHFAYRNGLAVLNKGLYFYYLGSGVGSSGCDNGYTCYSLYSAPSTAAKTLPTAITAAQSLWQETALMWEDRQVELRDELTTRPQSDDGRAATGANGKYQGLRSVDGGISTWVKAVGAWTNRSNYQSQWGGGGTALSYDLSYRQNSFGMMGGADWSKAGVLTPNDYLVVGVMGGYLNSNVNFNQEAGNPLGQANFYYKGGTVGGSISYMLNGFFADAMFKNDMLSSNLNIPAPGMMGSLSSVNTIGGIGNLGYRWNYGPMFVEPTATLTYSNTYMGSLNNLAAQGVNVSFGPGNDFRGGFGGRVGTSFGNLIDKHMLELSFTGRYWNMFNSNAGRTATIFSENVADTIGDYTYGNSYGEVKGNLNVYSLGSGISAFVNTGVRFNNHFQTVITKGGLAYRF